MSEYVGPWIPADEFASIVAAYGSHTDREFVWD